MDAASAKKLLGRSGMEIPARASRYARPHCLMVDDGRETYLGRRERFGVMNAQRRGAGYRFLNRTEGRITRVCKGGGPGKRHCR